MLDVLLLEDDPGIRSRIATAMRSAGHIVAEAATESDALAELRAATFDLVVCDARSAASSDLCRSLRRAAPDTDVMVLSAEATVSDAVATLKEGACDYIAIPVEGDELVARLARIDVELSARREHDRARAELVRTATDTPLVGRSPPITRLLHRIETFGESHAPVLITGETGTGKELVANMLHARSARRAGPFVAVSCAAFPETLLEAELFGYERGAFTGAVKRRDGRFAAAHGGTLLLDELAEMPLSSQAKLLRVLQEGKVEPLGTNQTVDVDVRVISATHQDVRRMVVEGRFRADLYYRLHVLDVHVPPLRERRGDLPLLVEHFLRRESPPGRRTPSLSPRAWAALEHHAFPGNVRELAHAIEYAVVLSGGGEIDVSHLPDSISGAMDDAAQIDPVIRPLGQAVREFEREYLLRALAASGGKRKHAAELLGMSRKSLWNKLRDLSLTSPTSTDETPQPPTSSTHASSRSAPSRRS